MENIWGLRFPATVTLTTLLFQPISFKDAFRVNKNEAMVYWVKT